MEARVFLLPRVLTFGGFNGTKNVSISISTKTRQRVHGIQLQPKSYRSNRCLSTAAVSPEHPPTLQASDPTRSTTKDAANLSIRPAEFVKQLDRFIIGQADAKKAVAVAFRNRWREAQLPVETRTDITSRNILMVGPTGSGKTEIARQVAKITGCPLVRTEATKFTELGFVGANIDDIIGDLVEASLAMVRARVENDLKQVAKENAEDKLLTVLMGNSSSKAEADKMLDMLRSGELDDAWIDVGSLGISQNPSMPDSNGTFALIDPNKGLMANFMVSSMGEVKSDDKKQKVTVSEARKRLEEAELEELTNTKELTKQAIALTEESGVIFLDEIDKICTRRSYYNDNGDAWAEGVQRDLLPLIEGTTVKTKHGEVKTDKVLFICAGAFHNCEVSDLLPELQGRLPIRVELLPLSEEDLFKVLKDTESNWLKQEVDLLQTEGVDVKFSQEALREMAAIAAHANRVIENIGARRLHTIVERVTSSLSFEVPEFVAKEINSFSDGLQVQVENTDKPLITITPEYVQQRLDSLVQKADLRKHLI